MTTPAVQSRADITVGGIKLRLHCDSREFFDSLAERFAGFLGGPGEPHYDFELLLQPELDSVPDEDVSVTRMGRAWRMRRGDFLAEWDPATRRGWIRQTANPYSLDSVLRIVHTLVLAREGGRLQHASSVVRDGRAYVFTGVSGVGKTTISRLAPPDARLLTDEMSFIRREGDEYFAYGTPFSGELGRPGENLRAPLAGVFLLVQGPENRIDPISLPEAVRGILANTLFFAQDKELVQAVFASAVELAEKVPVRRLTFLPDARVWDLIGR